MKQVKVCSWLLGGMLGFCAVTGGARTVFAQEATTDTPSLQFFKDGLQLHERGDYAAAAAKYRASLRAGPTFGASFNLADCEERLGHLALAFNEFMRALAIAESSSNVDRQVRARAAANGLSPKVVRLQFVFQGPDAGTIRIEGELLDPGLVRGGFAVAPGTATLEVTAPGRKTWSSRLDKLEAGALVTVNVPALVPEAAATPTTVVPAPAPTGAGAPLASTPSREGRSPWEAHRWSIITGGVAVALAGVGAGMGVKTWTHYSDLAEVCGARPAGCTQDEKDSVQSDALLTNVFFGAAGAAALGAAGIFFFAEQGPSNVQVGVAPGFVSVRGSY